MCGIAGWVDFNHPAASPELLARMTGELRHRGPDAQGYFERGPAHLGHCRLSIIDLACSAQPMGNEDGSIQLIFNGEIYNYRSLRNQLESRGHRFATQGDTEVITHLYEDLGEKCIQQLRGQFAFAIWDDREQRLCLARDRLGEKPLYYTHRDGRLIFASELRSILTHRDVSREIDPRALETYLACNYVPAPMSILKDVRKLPPAHWLSFDRSGIRIERYWRPSFSEKIQLDEHAAEQQLDELLRETIRLSMAADVPLGVFLSGGVDSSLVTAYMAQAGLGQVKTFSIGFEEQSYDETHYARQVAQRFGAEHHEFIVKPSAGEVLPEIARFMDEPMGDSSAIAFYYLAKLTRSHVTVALGGDGGDESFAGYARHEAMLLAERYQRLPSFMKRAASGASALLSNSPLRERWGVRNLARFLASADADLPDRYAQVMAHLPASGRRALLSSDLNRQLAQYDATEHISQALRECDSDDPLSQVLYADQMTYLPGDLLVKTDRMTMAHSLEGRSPLLDHHVVEFAARLPNDLKLHGRTRKYLLKRLLRRWFDDSFIHRRKMGFAVPLAEWFRGELRGLTQEYFNDLQLARSGWLNQQAALDLLQAHVDRRERHEHVLWSILLLEVWYRDLVQG